MGIPALDNLQLCYDSVTDLLASLDDDQWAVQSLCPDWDVRGVAMHLAGVESMLIGEEPGSWTDSVPFGSMLGSSSSSPRIAASSSRETSTSRTCSPG